MTFAAFPDARRSHEETTKWVESQMGKRWTGYGFHPTDRKMDYVFGNMAFFCFIGVFVNFAFWAHYMPDYK